MKKLQELYKRGVLNESAGKTALNYMDDVVEEMMEKLEDMLAQDGLSGGVLDSIMQDPGEFGVVSFDKGAMRKAVGEWDVIWKHTDAVRRALANYIKIAEKANSSIQYE